MAKQTPPARLTIGVREADLLLEALRVLRESGEATTLEDDRRIDRLLWKLWNIKRGWRGDA